MQSKMAMHQSPRCGAKTRQGKTCQAPAVRGRRRCRMHGGTNPGAPSRNKNALKHGQFSKEVVEEHQRLWWLLKQFHKRLHELRCCTH